MKADGYETLDEWEADYQLLIKHHNDTVLINAIATRVSKTKQELKEKIEDQLLSVMFERNPVGVMQMIAKKTGKIAVIKSKDDPFFDC